MHSGQHQSSVASTLDADLQKADEELSKFRFQDAFDIYFRVSQQAMKYPHINIARARAYMGLGDVYSQYGEFDKALSSYKQVLLINPLSSKIAEDLSKQAYLNCARSSLQLADLAAEDKDTVLYNAMHYYIHALVIDPECVEPKVLCNAIAQRHPLFSHVQALMKNVNCEEAYLVCATFYQSNNEKNKAHFCLEKVLRINPDNIMACVCSGIIHASKDDIALAFQRIRHALEIDKNYIEAHVALGNIYLDQDDIAFARQCFSTAARLTVDESHISSVAKKYFSEQLNLNSSIEYAQKTINAIKTIEARIIENQKRLLAQKGLLFSQSDNVPQVLNANECEAAQPSKPSLSRTSDN